MTATTPTARRTPLRTVGAFVEDRIRPLQDGYLADRSDAVAALAQLRRGAGKPIEATPELWGLTCDERLYSSSPRLDDQESFPAEVAAHIALTLYAVHQQSRTERMHLPGRDLGGAVRRLMPGSDIDEPLRKRFVQAGSASTIDSLAYRLRALVTLLRRDGIPLDYGLLADQLHQAQQPGGMTTVRRAWGRGFHAYRAHATESTGQQFDRTPQNSTTTADTTTGKDAE